MDTSPYPNVPLALKSEPWKGHWLHTLEVAYRGAKTPVEIRLLVATYGRTFPLIGSQITSGRCTWTASSQRAIDDNSWLAWTREACHPGTDQKLTIHLETTDPGPIAIWAVTIPTAVSIPAPHITGRSSQGADASYLYGHVTYRAGDNTWRVMDLLARMWDLDTSKQLMWGAVLLSLSLIGWGAYHAAAGGSWRSLAGLLALWVGLSCTYILLTPPFQAPDEPDHLLSYLAATEQNHLAPDALALANKGHFERIKFHPLEKFTAASAEKSQESGWAPHIEPPNPRDRSPLTADLWRGFGAIIHDLPLSLQLASLRMLQFGFVTLCLGMGMVLMRQKISEFMFVILAIPALPLFAFHVSNYFTTVGLSLFTGCALIAYLNTGHLAARWWPMLGLAIGLLPYSSAIGKGAVVFWLLLLPILVISSLDAIHQMPRAKRGALCGLFFLTAAIGPGLYGPIGFLEFSPLIGSLLHASSRHQLLEALPYLFPWLSLLMWVPPVFTFKESRPLNTVVGYTLKSATCLWLVVWIVAWLKPMAPLANIEETAQIGTQQTYVLKAIGLTFADLLPSPQLDYYLSATFWGGFGWLESIPAPWLLNLAIAPLGVGLFLGLLATLKAHKTGKMARYCVLMALLGAMLGSLAWDRWQAHINLHGRYLIVFYLYMAALAAAGWQDLTARRVVVLRKCILSPLYVLVIHGWTIGFIVRRYFGI